MVFKSFTRSAQYCTENLNITLTSVFSFLAIWGMVEYVMVVGIMLKKGTSLIM